MKHEGFRENHGQEDGKEADRETAENGLWAVCYEFHSNVLPQENQERKQKKHKII